MTDSKREMMSSRGNKRFVRRDSKGRFAGSGEASRSLPQDVRKRARIATSTDQQDHGDRER
jgi:hypothetical protein